MDNSVKTFLSFLISKNEKIRTKLFFASIFFLLMMLLNNIFGFSYYHNYDKKIKQVKELNILLNDTTVNIATKEKLKKIRKEILSRKNIFETISSYKVSPNDKEGTQEYVFSKEHKILNFLSTSWYFLIAFIISLLVEIKKSKRIDLSEIGTVILVGGMMLGISLGLSFLTNLIPIFNPNYVWLNYVFNFVITLMLFFKLIVLDIEGWREELKRV